MKQQEELLRYDGMAFEPYGNKIRLFKEYPDGLMFLTDLTLEQIALLKQEATRMQLGETNASKFRR